MFRVQFQPEHEELIKEIAGDAFKGFEESTYGKVAIIIDDSLKQSYKDTNLCGRGIAILGMKPFKCEDKTLIIEFDSADAASDFKSWLCRMEQHYWEWEENNGDDHHTIFEYHDPGGSYIRAKKA